jgi:hypothetical protein
MTRLELERERALLAALRGLARDLKEPAFDPQREQALLAIFDEACVRRSAHLKAPVWTGLAAAAFCGAILIGHLANRPGAPGIAGSPAAIVTPGIQQARALEPSLAIASAEPPGTRPAGALIQPVAVQSPPASDVTDFVAWPGATAWPPFESGELIRVELPIDGGVVEADVLVGQDGFARAVRLVR